MKLAPLLAACNGYKKIQPLLVHTGQHYDPQLSEVFFKELNMPQPDFYLGVGSGSHAAQTADVLVKFDEVLEKVAPDLVVVVGDVNSTIACALAAVKRGIKVAHVEAGLRSFDRTMPEEINRILTDRISDYFFCTEKSAVDNLKKEGAAVGHIYLVGNVMIDTLLGQKKRAQQSDILNRLNLTQGQYAVATLHRAANVDTKSSLQKLISLLKKTSMPVVFPVHPRTRQRIETWKISTAGLILTEPLGYLDFLKLVSEAKLVMTDSGGIQEETTVLGVPCLTLRDNTERPITISHGTNTLVGKDGRGVASALKKLKTHEKRPPLWDGKASERILKILNSTL